MKLPYDFQELKCISSFFWPKQAHGPMKKVQSIQSEEHCGVTWQRAWTQKGMKNCVDSLLLQLNGSLINIDSGYFPYKLGIIYRCIYPMSKSSLKN